MTDRDRARLAAILGMLGSDHAGERAAAAQQAEAFRKRNGLTWAELLALPPLKPEPPPPRPEPPPATQADPYAHAPSWAKPDTRPRDPVPMPEIQSNWTVWDALGMVLWPWLLVPWMLVGEPIRIVRWICLYGFVPWVREKVRIYAFGMTVTFGTLIVLRYVTGVH